MSNDILLKTLSKRGVAFFFCGQPTAFFLSFLNFVVVVAFAPFLQQGGELFFFSEKLLSFLPLFFGALYTQKVTIYPIYNNRLRNARGYIFIRNACVPLKQNKFS